ncbi:restriction endonuclease subunit S [Clostridium sp.]|uniref:restriction endonuclease subunit S n=1 Tax=Clostridium sp. TaxID=1506 RepID=UPI00262C4760|nr:restriction endonuclease subunit S [Clostridium sp.]
MNNEIAERIQLIKEGNVPEGYRNHSDFKAPNDWDVLDLGKIMNFKNGLNYGKNDVGEEIKILGVGDFQKNFYLNTNDLNKIKYSDLDMNYLLENGDLIFVRSNGNKELIGRVLYCENIEEKVTYSGFTIRGRLNSNNFLDKYCAYYCSSNLVKKQYMKNGGGTNINNLSQDILSNVKITKPSIKEQEKIIRIISAFDRLIKLKEKLLQEKQKQKKGLMERLLTEKIRINGFNEKWKKVKLGTVMKERNEIGYNELELLAITSANGVVRRTEVDIKDTSSEDKSKYKRILPGDIGYNTMRMWQGVSGLSKYEGIVSPAYTILKPTEKVDSEFMSYLFKLPQVINLFYRYSQGLVSDTYNLKYENFKGIKVNIPAEVKEQKQIATILRTADKEIDLLKKELEALKQQKKGLTQLLLTGIVRV